MHFLDFILSQRLIKRKNSNKNYNINLDLKNDKQKISHNVRSICSPEKQTSKQTIG